MRRGIPSSPTMCIGKKTRFVPMNIVQKFQVPNVSSIRRPVNFGNQ